MFVFGRKNLDPKWHFFQEKLLYIFISQSPKYRAGVKLIEREKWVFAKAVAGAPNRRAAAAQTVKIFKYFIISLSRLKERVQLYLI